MPGNSTIGPPAEMFRVHARLSVFRRKVERAERVIREWLEHCSRPYVAFSGGKDSTCVLDLVRQVSPSAPAVYLDADCAFPEVTELLKQTPNVILHPCVEPFIETLKRHSLEDDRVECATMRTTVTAVVPALIAQYGFDGCAYGLRAEESMHRRVHFVERGHTFFSRRYGIWTCQPIADWTYRDVWAYIFSREIRYCGTYDKMWWMPERAQRISYWAGESNRRNGRYAWLKRNYPDLFNRLAREITEVTAYV